MSSPSLLAKIRFIADSTPQSFWGSNEREERLILEIRKRFANYLFKKPPRELLAKLRPMVNELLGNGKFDEYASWYEEGATNLLDGTYAAEREHGH